MPSVLRSSQEWVRQLHSESEAGPALTQLTERVELRCDGISLSLKLPVPVSEERNGVATSHIALTRFFPMRMRRRGIEMRMVLEGDSTPARVDLSLVKAVARGRIWSQDMISGRAKSVVEIAKREGFNERSVRRLIQLGFLAPRIVEAIVEGREPPELTARGLTRRIDLPMLWSEQERLLGLS